MIQWVREITSLDSKLPGQTEIQLTTYLKPDTLASFQLIQPLWADRMSCWFLRCLSNITYIFSSYLTYLKWPTYVWMENTILLRHRLSIWITYFATEPTNRPSEIGDKWHCPKSKSDVRQAPAYAINYRRYFHRYILQYSTLSAALRHLSAKYTL